ncbi:MAG: wax ester/triacylglycerol synthase family O-acyltransferase [Myxococcota bacterium]|nr:wax ester/triacylglycerol synthase family O-acyltransferase [Myxococcota bacterium]
MDPRHPHQLADGDAVFLSIETPASGAHVGALMVLDPSSRPGFRVHDLREHIAARLALVPRFGWKLQSVPLDLDRPYWVPAEDYDPLEHIVHGAVPAPGTPQQLAALASRLHMQPLDRTRPLWEAWCIEGLADGRFALYLKAHHCLLDGSSGNGMAAVMADLTPDAATPQIPEGFREAPPAPPGALEVWTRAAQNAVARPGRLLGHLGRGMRDLAGAARPAPEPVPRLAFNRSVGRRRALATASLSFERLRDLKKHFDVTVNDVVLALVGSALRRWLRERSELPDQPLAALCPVSKRGDQDGLGNEITNMAVSLATDLDDPAERLRAIHASAQRAKQGVSRGSFDWLAAVGESLTPGAAQLLARTVGQLGDAGPLPGNLVVSNVRGTPVPIYLGGARVESMMPMSMLAPGQGLNITLVSYCDRIDVGILVDPALVADPWELAAHFEPALEELEAAANGVVHRAG